MKTKKQLEREERQHQELQMRLQEKEEDFSSIRTKFNSL
jgi:hypothetical protein